MPPVITLTPYTQLADPWETAEALSRQALSIEEQLRAEMPYALRRYATGRAARDSIHGVRMHMSEARNAVAYVVSCDGTTIGVVTCHCVPRRWWYGMHRSAVLARGPVIAGWLGRMGRPSNLMGLVLRELAQKLAATTAFSSTPWTLVRVGHPTVPQGLEDITNGFGGFLRVNSPHPYQWVDGLKNSQRQLFVARTPLESLRDQ